MELPGAIAQSFYAAAAGLSDWESALAGLADITGSRAGQLIGLGAPAVLMNRVSGVPQELIDEFVEINGGDPSVNRRVAAGLKAPELMLLAEEDFATPEQLARDPHYTDFCARYDIPHICLTTLIRDQDRLVGLSVLRSRRQGAIDAEGRKVMAALAPHIQGAVRISLALEEHGIRTLADGFEAAGMAAIIVDSQGCMLSSTPRAIDFVARATHLTIKGRMLGAVLHLDDHQLRFALAQLHAPNPLPVALVIRTAEGTEPVPIDILPLPRDHDALGFRQAGLVLIGSAGTSKRRGTALLRSAFNLTTAEADVTAALVENGVDVVSVAVARGVSVGTIRNQLKSIYSKLGVSRQAELSALARPFL